jgi:hypothetical protein
MSTRTKAHYAASTADSGPSNITLLSNMGLISLVVFMGFKALRTRDDAIAMRMQAVRRTAT